MPLYEYECQSCGHRFERIQKFSDAPVEACPLCGGAVQKLVSSPAFQFKGSGWYVTDYAKKGDAAKTSETASVDAKEKSTSESKPASTDSSSTKETKDSSTKDRSTKDAAPSKN